MSSTPPPPSTNAGASVSEPVQQCPLKPQTPCDVDKLTIVVTGKDGKGSVTRKLSTTKRRHSERVRDVRSRPIRRLLRTYDLIIDIIADPDVSTAPSTAAVIEGSAQFHGRSCALQLHPMLALRPLGLAPELAGNSELVTIEPGAARVTVPKTEVYALQSFIDRNTSHSKDSAFDTATDLFAIIVALWDATKDKAVELRAYSCGVRAREDRKAANQTLLALARIHRDSKWSIGVKIPPLGSFKAERKEMRVGREGIREVTTSREVSAGMGYYQTSDTHETSGEGLLANETRSGRFQRGSDVSAIEVSRTVEDGSPTRTITSKSSRGNTVSVSSSEGHVTAEVIKERLRRAHGFEIVITHNGTEVAALEAIKRVKEQIEKITKALTDIDALFDKVPQVGWKFGFEVSVLTGTILLEWWPEYVNKVLANGRYYPVQNRLQGKISMTIVDVEMSLSFGVDARALDSGLVVKIAGSINLAATIDADISLTLLKPRQTVDVSASADAKISVVGFVSLLGKTVADAVLTAHAGLELAGQLEIDMSRRKLDLHGRLESKAIQLDGYISIPWWPDKTIDPPIVVLKPQTLYDFD